MNFITFRNCFILSDRLVKVIEPFEDQCVVEEEDATFFCILSDSNAAVTWFKNGKIISNNDKAKIESEGAEHKLTLLNNLYEDGGCISLFSENARVRMLLM